MVRIKKLKNVKNEFWLRWKEIKSLFKIVEKINKKIWGGITKKEKIILEINKSSLVVMLYGFVERLLSVLVQEIYNNLKSDVNLNYSELIESLKKHISKNLMKINSSRQRDVRHDVQGDFLYNDLYKKEPFPISHCLLIDYDGIKKPMCISNNIQYKEIKDILEDFDLKDLCWLDGSRLSNSLDSLLIARNILSHWWKSFQEYWKSISISDFKRWLTDVEDMYNTIILWIDKYLIDKKYMIVVE